MQIERRTLFATLAATWLGQAAWADTARANTAPPSRIRGTIDAMSGQTLSITDRDGAKVSVALRTGTTVTEIAPAKLADIKPGSYIGTAAMPQPDGSLMAMEIQVFPERMRGVGEGNRPWDLRPQSTMTNGTVGSVTGTAGRVLTLKYAGGEKKVTVPEQAPIITYEPGNVAMLKPGAHVLILASKTPDGGWTADRVSVGRDGLVPPM